MCLIASLFPLAPVFPNFPEVPIHASIVNKCLPLWQIARVPTCANVLRPCQYGNVIAIFHCNATVAEKPAVKVVMDDPGGMKVFRVYLDCGSAIAYVSFAVPAGEFSSAEASLDKSVASLRME